MTERPIVSTHRLQLEPDFTLDDAVAQVDHLATLGVSHLYLSPILQASAGSKHGYDVIDHTAVAEGLGGDEAFARLVAAAHAAGLGVVVDVVPNHMTTPTPLWLNRPLWSVLREGRGSSYASWFDIDWDAQGGRILMPVLGAPLDEVLAAGDITLGDHEGEPVVRYYDHVFPLAAGSDTEAPIGELVEAQHYRLASWTIADDELNYRRFFDVTSLIAVRVEEPEVFDETHRLLIDGIRSGAIDGLRIDHPDGLADPEGYLERLAEVTDGAWVVVEKILEGDERLPAGWRTAGTTGYDALLRVGGLFVDPDGAGPLDDLSAQLLGEHQDLEAIITESKRWVVQVMLAAEVSRLMRLVARARPDLEQAAAREVVEAMLVGMDRYRVYIRPGVPASAADAAELESTVARGARPGVELPRAVVEAVIDLALGQASPVEAAAQDEFVVRFQQTCGPAMAKAIEDTAYYRYVRLVGLNEVGGDPTRVGVSTSTFHAFARGLLERSPRTMTTLSTHDTKRAEDVRARLAVLAERPAAWAEWLAEARRLAVDLRSDELDVLTEYFLWQTAVGAWPISEERLQAYALKAIRESKLFTRWTEPNTAYESAVEFFVAGLVSTPEIVSHLESWVEATGVETRANVLGQKLVQLTMPGVPDVYQGTDLVDLSLVDPDNRRLVDYDERRRRLARLDAGVVPSDLHDEKLLVTAAALRTRREWSECFVGPEAGYQPLETTSPYAVAFGRGAGDGIDVVTVVTRLAGRLRDAGGFGDSTLTLPDGEWTDVLAQQTVDGGAVQLASLVGDPDGLPVALLVRVGEEV
ncbi:maltooligosyl trehalose synthase [Humibacillus xanthopallidus]|uniref:Maltooligosyl trehalose synthase n=1 Tax=Humibacillus xanthopallidus TaxID=412689 RepID=A0A543PWJ9_9MICO|nr:malto-oligosyltrehalose synthase [Humibacillus xanthopallidus]TQN48454.1 maltooligosyl trehalose synthase [Humibacillus xanthopallidus]